MRHLSDLQWAGVVRRGWPIVTFVFGLLLGAFIYEAEERRKIKVPFSPAIGLEALLIAIFIAAGIGSGFSANIPPQPACKFFLMVALLAIPIGIQSGHQKSWRNEYLYDVRYRNVSEIRRKFAVNTDSGCAIEPITVIFRTAILIVLRVSPRTASFQRAAINSGFVDDLSGGRRLRRISIQRWALLRILVRSCCCFQSPCTALSAHSCRYRRRW